MSKIGAVTLQFLNANSHVSATLHLGGTVNLECVVYAVIVMCLSHHVNYLIDEAVVSHFHSHYHKAWCTLSLQLHYNDLLLVKRIVFSFPAL